MVARKFTVLLEPAEEGGFIIKCVEGYLEVKAKLLKRKAKGERAEVIVEAPSALVA